MLIIETHLHTVVRFKLAHIMYMVLFIYINYIERKLEHGYDVCVLKMNKVHLK